MAGGEEVVFKPRSKSAVLPRRHSEGAAGYDLHSVGSGTIPPHTTMALRLGFSMELPNSLLGYICGRSGLALRNGIEVSNSYARSGEEVVVYLRNNLDAPFHFDQGSRVAQLVFFRIANARFVDQE